MSYEQALGAIIRELRDVEEFRSTLNGKAYYVRTSGKWHFRAAI
jgi:septal ring-binding cell division protein DamX